MSKRIGRYEIQAELGHGGQGQVYRAFDPTVGRMVAIKTLVAENEPELLTRFRNEAAAAGNLHHPNIVTIYDFGDDAGSPFLVMELLDGETVENIIASRRPLTLLQKLHILMQVADGLHHAHVNKVIHRDVKPANMMVLRDGTVKILDFGIALLSRAASTRLTAEGALIGTLRYMAPEQFYGTSSDVLTDIFAFGITCYRLLTAVHPFEAAEMSGLMYNILNRKPSAIRALNPECPEALEEAVLRMLSKDRDSRYQSLEDVQLDIKPVVADLRKESIGDLLVQARDLLDRDQLETAQTAVRQALSIDPTNRVARELREQIQKLIRGRTVQPRIAALVSEGRGQLEVRQFDQAIQKFESAAQLDRSNPELQALIDQARAAWEQSQRADRLTEEVRQALRRGDLTAAHERVIEAIAADPKHREAEALLAAIQKEIQTRELERRQRESLDHVKGLMLLHSFEQAIEELQRIQTEFPDFAEAGRLLDRALKEQASEARKQRLQAATDEAKQLLRNRRFREAAERLTLLRVEFPESSEILDLDSYAQDELRAQRQGEMVARVTEEVRALMGEGDFDGALEQLRGALVEHPGASALRELLETVVSARSERHRNTALSEALKQAVALKDAGRFAESLERIAAFVSSYGESAALDQLRRQAEAGLERQRRVADVRKLIREAQGLLDDGRTSAANEVLQEGTVRYPNDPDVARLLSVARSRLREEQDSEAISKIVLEAESMARTRQFDRALALVDEGLRQYSGAERLLRCRDAIVASQAAHQRESFRRAAIDRARRLQDEGRLLEALQIIDEAIAAAGEDPELIALRKQIGNKPETPGVGEAFGGSAAPAQEARDGCIEQLLALECQIAAAPKSRMNELRVQAAGLAQAYPADREIVSLVERINRQIESAPAAPAKGISWKWIGAAAAVLLIASAAFLFRGEPEALPVEVRTDPPGATVRLAEQSCVTPDCSLSLRPGQYEVLAQLDGYQPARGTLTVEAGRSPSPLSIVLQPLPAAVPPTVSVKEDRPAPPGVETGARGKASGVSPNRGQTAVAAVPPVTITPVKPPATVPPPVADPAAGRGEVPAPAPPPQPVAEDGETRSRREWEEIRNSSDIAAVEAFIRKYPTRPVAADAARRLVELEWERVNKQDPAALTAYLNRFADSPYAAEARSRLANLQIEADRRGVLQSLASFASAFNNKNLDEVMRIWPGGPRATFQEAFDVRPSLSRISGDTEIRLVAQSPPVVTQDSATVRCTRTTIFRPRRGQRRGNDTVITATVQLRLQRRGGQWIITALEVIP